MTMRAANSTTMTPGYPLAGVTVIDLGQIYNGPYCTFMMAMAGANIIKIETLDGENLRRRRRFFPVIPRSGAHLAGRRATNVGKIVEISPTPRCVNLGNPGWSMPDARREGNETSSQ